MLRRVLSQIWHVFRNVFPCRHRRSLTSLPPELILIIASYLPLTSLNSLLRTTTALFELLTPVILNLAAGSRLPRNPHRYVLHWAAAHNRPSLMRSLLSRGAQKHINHHIRRKMTPLLSAVSLGYEEPVRILLDNGANPEALNRAAWTALMTAVITNNVSLCTLLLDKGANIDAKGYNMGGNNALHYAAGLGQIEIVDLLVKRGCDTTALNGFGGNAIHTAACCEQKMMVKHLLEMGEFRENQDVSDSVTRAVRSFITDTSLSIGLIIDHERESCGPCRI